MASLGDLKALQRVDLSHNKLEGHIPSYSTDLASLVYLNLSYNDLKGAVPKDGVFKNLSAISLQGNVQLHGGGISELHLPHCAEGKRDGQKRAKNVKVILLALDGSITFIVFVGNFYFWEESTEEEKLYLENPRSNCI